MPRNEPAHSKLTWSVRTPWPARGAIALIELHGDPDAIDTLTSALGAGRVAVPLIRVRMLAEIDRCVLARVDDRTLLIFPHAGKRILELIASALTAHGAVQAHEVDPCLTYPEAESKLEARMLAALATAASPMAIDILLAQPRRWAAAAKTGEVDRSTARNLQRLLTPPLVAAIGRPNVGKSSLLNALAGRRLSIVADLPGTTRDHVGATLDLGGLVVRWMDCPGLNPDESNPIQIESQRMALEVAAAADLLVVCGDAASGFPTVETLPKGLDRVLIALRSDLGLPSGWTTAAASVKAGTGLDRIVTLIRDRLVPAAARNDQRAWRFWDASETDSGSM